MNNEEKTLLHGPELFNGGDFDHSFPDAGYGQRV
jgi:hypothetical protein